MCIYIPCLTYFDTSSRKVPLNKYKMHRFRSSCTCSKYYQGLCSPFIHSVVDSEGPDQTAQMCVCFVILLLFVYTPDQRSI